MRRDAPSTTVNALERLIRRTNAHVTKDLRRYAVGRVDGCLCDGKKQLLCRSGLRRRVRASTRSENPIRSTAPGIIPRNSRITTRQAIASWYGPSFYGRATANGEVYNAGDITAAHRTLPMPVNVRVTNLDNGKSVIVRVNDRGPYAKGRIIDVSEQAAKLLGFYNQGHGAGARDLCCTRNPTRR
ncbi:MAG: septal ring lytic transglycosylase RlpA family protein [Rhizomicrobium sp.]